MSVSVANLLWRGYALEEAHLLRHLREIDDRSELSRA